MDLYMFMCLHKLKIQNSFLFKILFFCGCYVNLAYVSNKSWPANISVDSNIIQFSQELIYASENWLHYEIISRINMKLSLITEMNEANLPTWRGNTQYILVFNPLNEEERVTVAPQNVLYILTEIIKNILDSIREK